MSLCRLVVASFWLAGGASTDEGFVRPSAGQHRAGKRKHSNFTYDLLREPALAELAQGSGRAGRFAETGIKARGARRPRKSGDAGFPLRALANGGAKERGPKAKALKLASQAAKSGQKPIDGEGLKAVKHALRGVRRSAVHAIEIATKAEAELNHRAMQVEKLRKRSLNIRKSEVGAAIDEVFNSRPAPVARAHKLVREAPGKLESIAQRRVVLEDELQRARQEKENADKNVADLNDHLSELTRSVHMSRATNRRMKH